MSLNNDILKITTGFESVSQFLYVNDFVKIILMFIEDFNNITFENVNYEIINKEEGKVKKRVQMDCLKYYIQILIRV